METVKLTLEDMKKLGVSWSDFCDATDTNVYAIREGLPEDTIFDVPVNLIRHD